MTWADLDSELGELFGDLQGADFNEQIGLAVLHHAASQLERLELARKACRFPGCTQPKVVGRAECYCEEHRAQRRIENRCRSKAAEREQQRRKRARRKAAGLCQACGRSPAEKPTTLCSRCRVAASDAGKRAYRRRREASS